MSSENFDEPGRVQPARQSTFESGNLSVIIFLTVCTAQRKPILANAEAHCLLRESWEKAAHWSVGRYVILPEHIPLFCSPATQNIVPIRKWVQYWKALVSKEWPKHSEHPIRQRDIWDTQLRRSENYCEKWEYVRNNPVRHRLVQAADLWEYQGEINSLTWLDR